MNVLGVGWPELLLIALICILIFGIDNLPDMAKSLAKRLKALKKALEGITREDYKN
ncbi:MAG: twin-arginine translocase TatA/TatE family subunit [Candidatus Omnitrophica bacterium]|nr:twin-arginine translocase TatA/TatE family subunit [Candidatus Omnitrophota bacterium]